MADASPADLNPFDQFKQAGDNEAAPDDNPFNQFKTVQPAQTPSSTTGAFVRGAERSVLPAVGSLPAIGAGAEIGAAAGAAVGGPFAPVTAPVGGLIGGAIGGFGASALIARAQNWGLSQLPDSWKDKLGLSERQQQIDEGEHPTASFLGGLLPYAVTMRPGAVPKTPLPENATALQRILSHPVTARLFGGAAMGGMELGQEEVEDHQVSWPQAAIATAFGMVFNRPTQFGERITELGARPARTAIGIPHPSPTLAQAADAKVMGPGVTEQVFQGAHEQDPSAQSTAQESVRQEQIVTGQQEPPADVHEIARRMNPELFAHYDDLLERQKSLQGWLAEEGLNAPAAAQHLADTTKQIDEVGPEVAAAYRRAAETTQSATVQPPERFPSFAAMLAAQGTEHLPNTSQTEPPEAHPSIEQQRDFIRNDVSRQLIAAGRPQEEAQAAGALVAARYETRAARFNGSIGTAQQLYEREGAEIRAAKKPPSQGGGSAPATPTPPSPPPIDNTHDVVSGANSAKAPGGTVYIDRRIPRFTPQLETSTGASADLHKYLSTHEIEEKQAMAEGLPYDEAHQRATAAEKAAVEADGVSWKRYTEVIDGYLSQIEKEKAENPPTEALHVNSQDAIGHHRSQSKEGTQQKAPDLPPAAPARKARNPESYSLLEFLAANGGIRSDDPLANDLRQSFGGRNKFVPGFGMLIRDPKQLSTAAQRGGAKAPKYLDMAREAAVEAGYLADIGDITHGVSQSTISDLLEAVDREERGQKVYRQGHEREAAERDEQSDYVRAGLREDMRELGITMTKAEENRAVELYMKEGIDDPTAIMERIALETDNREIEGGAIPRDEPIPGWDEPYEPARPSGEGTAAPGAKPVEPGGAAARSGGENAGARARFQAFLDNRGAVNKSVKIARGFNDDRTRSGLAPMRGRASQQWELGNVVNVGFVKDLLIAKQETDGSYLLLARPDEKGVSKAYNAKPHAGLLTEEPRNFLEATKDLAVPTKPQEVEYFQRKPRSLIEEREAQGQAQLPGAERISDAELAQRKANEPLKPSVEQKPMDEGLFSDQKDQRELFQSQLGKIRLGGNRPIITLARTADASTFIHETGHQWLEELMRDASHEQAPDVLKADASTVRDWIGAKEGETIPTRAHEEFARGFEQYMREGIAPSPELASVFSKFRDWLLRIYQTIRGLGDKITPQIRSVFDRMLATEPQRTVIAPERMERPTLADIHEADARETEPEEAHASGDRITAETQAFIDNLPPAIREEHDAAIAKTAETQAEGIEPSGQAPAGESQPGALQPDRGGPGLEPAGGAGSPERRAQLPGGGGPVPEGAGSPGPIEPAESGADAAARDQGLGDKPLAPRPAVQFGGAESPLVDKAGNIRLENLTNVEDVREAIRAAARENEDFIGDRRGVVTDGQVMDLAADLGMAGAEDLVKRRVIGQAFNAEQVVALRKLLVQSATELSAAMKKASQGSDEDVLAYAKAKDRHQLIQATVSQATAEAGRALRAFRNITGDIADINEFAKQATGRTLFQLRQEAALGAALDTPQQVSKFTLDAQNRTFGKMVLEYWINGLISGPATHATYVVGNAILAAEKAGPETAAAAAIGALRKTLGRQGETVRLGEVAEQFKAGAKGIPSAVKAALDALRTGQTTLLPGERVGQNILPFPGTELAQAAMHDDAATFSDAVGTAYGMLRGAFDGLRAGGELLKAGGLPDAPLAGLRYSHLGAIPDVEIRGLNVLPIGTAARLPSRFVAAIHSFFRSVNYSMEKNRLAYRQAMNEGLSGTDFDSRLGELRQNPPEAMMEASRGEATQLTLMGQGGEFTQALSRLTNAKLFGLPILKFIDPFVHISANIIEQSIIERTPLGILSPEIRSDLMGKNGNIAQDTAMARMLMGTVYGLALGGLAAEGYVSGSEPSDPRQAAVWRLAGNQAHSVRIGDIWYDVHRLGPMGMLMGIAADMYDVSHLAEQGDMLNAASHLQHAITQNILDESFMRGPSDLIKAVDDPGRYGESYIRNFLSSFLPYSVGMSQVARASDPYSRQARSVMDSLKQKIPGMSEQLLPRRDIWGEALPNRDALIAPGVTAIYETRQSRDPVNLALLDLGISPAYLERKIRNVPLTDDQYDDFQRIAGRMTKMRLDAIVNSPDYATWPNHIRANIIREVIAQSRESARGVMMAKYPQIVRDATELKLKKVRGE